MSVGAGLPGGNYYYQVTDPSGSTLLSTEPIGDRMVEVVGGRFAACVYVCPYDDTPNPGGEYKVWATAVADYNPADLGATFGFVSAKSKTDNFKVKGNGEPPQPPAGVISGVKYYDTNLNGELDLLSDIPIACWLIELYENSIDPANLVASAYTGPAGSYVFEDLVAGTYVVREVMPLGSWVQTGPNDSSVNLDPNPDVTVTALDGVYTVELATDNAVTEIVHFGNVCLGAGGGRTMGFWTNKNGQRVIGDNWSASAGSGVLNCPVLDDLPNTNATPPYLSNGGAIKTFLRKADAVDMQYMLAAQWLAMELNIICGYVDPLAMVYTGSGFVAIGDVVALVCTDGASWDRELQEAYKDILDAANNDETFVQPEPCLPIEYGPGYLPCLAP